MKLKIRNEHLKVLEKEARKSWPVEACAILIGHRKNELSEVVEVVLTQNVDASSITFKVDPLVLYNIYRKAEAEGREVVGVFHSHPAPPRPSGIDAEYMKVTLIPWLIMSMPSRSLGAYIWKDGSIIDVELEVIDQNSK